LHRKLHGSRAALIECNAPMFQKMIVSGTWT
jgi:hypothetical protein